MAAAAAVKGKDASIYSIAFGIEVGDAKTMMEEQSVQWN